MPTQRPTSPLASDLPTLGLRPTLPRQAVRAVFQASNMRHLSAEDVYRQALARGTAISLSTVYKVLSQFEQVGLLRRSELGHSQTVYELNDPAATRHGHLVCALSGKVIELHLPELEAQLALMAHRHGLQLGNWSLTAWGHPVAGTAASAQAPPGGHGD